ncbi:AAA family ATPase [Hymenobacter cheonanensis]|uniref:AAA family ATPase n=1 Tax=Hymenobacter sp. CA2-7 TaxID=3063993 RepID=UPI00271257F9|nr:DUF3696 domain-containing protein [Hymenobacter sp. CA2-7]MDO7884188.1 DUF3696 domain-containing protein [Hymenobacter sp. CA2-7]
MLERLRIQNFKSWQDTGDMAFGSLTGFFGTNSSGKSSILQFLLMLKQTVESSDRSQIIDIGDDKSYVDLGTLQDTVYRSATTLDFTLSFNAPIILFDPSRMDGPEEIGRQQIKFLASIEVEQELNYLNSFSYEREGWKIGVQHIATEEKDSYYTVFNVIMGSDTMEDNPVIISRPIKFYGFPFELFKYFADTSDIQDLTYSLERTLSDIYYLGPLRDYPRRTYVWGGGEPDGVGNRGERAISALLASRNQGPTISMGKGDWSRTVEEHVAHWLKELGLIYSFKVQPIAPNRKEYEVRIQRTAESASVFLTDVGFGVSQILPVLVLLFYVPEGSTVILEQPEIHLHPAVQAGLADVFIDAIKRRKLQIILESHSEHLLQRLQRRMAEELIAPDDIKLYFTSIEAGKSKLTPLELDEYGNINNWPEGFFGDTMGEAAAMMKAEMERRMRQQPS